jgi:hypothetical protein
MGATRFLLPAGLTPEAARELELAYIQVIDGPDYRPLLTEAVVQPPYLTVQRAGHESGYLTVPWEVPGHGRLMLSTATLVEREAPYDLAVELARGCVNFVRNQADEWIMGGLEIGPDVAEALRGLNHSFASTVCCEGATKETARSANDTITRSVVLGDQLVRLFTQQVFAARHQRFARFDTALACRLTAPPAGEEAARLFRQTFNAVQIPFRWADIEPTESAYQWDGTDALVKWAQDQGFALAAGPLLDFAPNQFPLWLGQWQTDLPSLANFMYDYVESALRRYGRDIRVWHLTAATNWSTVLGLEEEDLLWLTVRLLELCRQVDPEMEVIVGLAQPWGEYITKHRRSYFPLLFADALLRSRLRVTAFDLEVVMGVTERGSYPRDLLQLSRLLDLYTLLNLPVRVTIACPSQTGPDPLADPAYQVRPRGERAVWDEGGQADWTADVAALCLCKPCVASVCWPHYSDAEPHLFPHCGLLDGRARPKPALERLRVLRERHLV